MEINPYESRLRMLQQFDGVQMQREAAPDAETAGCPGCPYFWTCPIPHKGEEVRVPQEIELEDVRGELGPRRDYRPRDESDIGWADDWVDEDEDVDQDQDQDQDVDSGTASTDEQPDSADDDTGDAVDEGTDDVVDGETDNAADHGADDAAASAPEDHDTEYELTRRRSWWNPFSRRR